MYLQIYKYITEQKFYETVHTSHCIFCIFSHLKHFFLMFIFLRESARAHAGGAEKEGDTES